MNEEQFDALWKNLVSRKHANPKDALTKQERLFYAANLLRGSVPRSGFIGYFEGSTGDDLREAYEALRAMRLDDVLLLLQRAQLIALRDKPLPEGSNLIEVIPDDLDEEAYEKASDKLDVALVEVQQAFCECAANLFEALCRFADQNDLV